MNQVKKTDQTKPTSFWSRLKSLIYKYRHGVFLLYVFVFFPWFGYLEKTITTRFHIVHMVLDDYIPFIEYFIVPYLIWYLYVAVPVLFFFFFEVDNFKKVMTFLITGMTIFLIISTIYPNGAYLRPIVFPRDNIFTELVKGLYKTDTATNLFPSMHVFNSIAVHWGIAQSKHFKKRKKVVYGSQILMILIVLSTVFLKQHSLFDLLTGVGPALILGVLVYPPEKLKQQIANRNITPTVSEPRI